MNKNIMKLVSVFFTCLVGLVAALTICVCIGAYENAGFYWWQPERWTLVYEIMNFWAALLGLLLPAWALILVVERRLK